MGVPRLFRWFCNNFPDQVCHFRDDFTKTIDHVYFDANGLLHNAAQKVHNYGQNKRMRTPYDTLTLEEKNEEVYKHFFDRILSLCKIISPRKTLFLAIDGPAPLSKQAQQRQRRFVSARSRGVQENGDVFDSNCITPGTEFMKNLTVFMRQSITTEMTRKCFSASTRLRVIFSPPTTPGEGEHKILDYIRGLDTQTQTQDTHCLFGPDGDLIMLTLSAHIPKMFLFREDIYNFGWYHLIDMGAAYQRMPLVLQPHAKVRRTPRDSVNDFIIQGFFVGNDFLPRIKMFYMLEEGIERMISGYSLTQCGLSQNDGFDIEGFTKFVAVISQNEEEHLVSQLGRRLKDIRFRDDTMISHTTETLPSTNADASKTISRVLDFEGYRASYYARASLTEMSDLEKRVRTMCFDYLKTLIWIFEYYVHGLPSWRWSYDWYYAPLMTDFSKFLTSMTPAERKKAQAFVKGGPSTPTEQLLSVLPPVSCGLVPEKVKEVMVDENSTLSRYYPRDFEIDYEGKMVEHEGIARLPFVSHARVREVVKSYSGGKLTRPVPYDQVYTVQEGKVTVEKIKK